MIKTARSFKSISLSLLSSVLLFTSAASPALAEYWSPSGNNIYKNNFGNVGIGISSPLTPLHVNIDTSTYGAIRVSEGATTAIDLGDATGVGVNGIAALFSNGTEKIRLFADPTQNSWINAGNFGIGTNAPDSKLTVNGSTKVMGSPASTPLLTVDSNADGKYSAYIVGPNPGLAIRNTGDPATTGLYKFVSSGNAFLLYQNTAAAGDFSTYNNIMTWKAGGNVGIGGIPGSYKLDVAGTVKASGAIGINGLTPGAVVGGQATGLAVSGYTGLGGLRLNGADATNTIYQATGDLGITTAPGSNVSLGDTNGAVLKVKDGRVGIGTPTSPDYKLIVDGNVGIIGSLTLTANNIVGGNLDVVGTTALNGVTTARAALDVTGGNLRADKNDGTVTTASITSTGWKTHVVTFPTAWTVVPTVVVSRYYGGTGTMAISEINVSSTTVNGFTILFNVTSLTTSGTVRFNWMAL